MNAEDELIWGDSSSRVPLTCARIQLNCTELYGFGNEYPMNDDATRSGLHQLSETSCSRWGPKCIRRGIVWQAAYGPRLVHPKRVAAAPQRSNHSEDVILSSSLMTPYAH